MPNRHLIRLLPSRTTPTLEKLLYPIDTPERTTLSWCYAKESKELPVEVRSRIRRHQAGWQTSGRLNSRRGRRKWTRMPSTPSF